MRQPNWKRWEVILLVDMYFRVQDNPEQMEKECDKLSVILRRSNIEKSLNDSKYRNKKGILMKYQNIRHIVEGKGLSSFSKTDMEIVNYYLNDKESFDNELKKIWNCIS